MERNLMVEGLVLQRVVHRLDRCKSEVCSMLLKLVGAEGNTRLKIELAITTRFPFCVQKEKRQFCHLLVGNVQLDLWFNDLTHFVMKSTLLFWRDNITQWWIYLGRHAQNGHLCFCRFMFLKRPPIPIPFPSCPPSSRCCAGIKTKDIDILTIHYLTIHFLKTHCCSPRRVPLWVKGRRAQSQGWIACTRQKPRSRHL